MNGERGRGVVLHLLALLLVAAGAIWWWRAEPRATGDPRLMDWRRSAEQLLPDVGDQEAATTVALDAGSGHETVAEIEGSGNYLVSVVCAGDSGSRVRVSLGGAETGRGVRCSGARTPDMFSVGLASDLRMRVNVDDKGPVVFRYTVQRLRQ